ncbi:MAG: OadG family protein [Oscillospiraceae bacterium]
MNFLNVLQSTILATKSAADTPKNVMMPIPDIMSIVVTGLVIVFIGLILLIFFVKIITFLMEKGKKSKSAEVKVAKPKAVVVSKNIQAAPAAYDGISDEIVAVISAAIAAMSSESGTTYSLKSIKKAKIGRPIWSLAGLQDNTRTF